MFKSSNHPNLRSGSPSGAGLLCSWSWTFIHVVLVDPMIMPVMEIVGVVVMLHWLVAAVGAMGMGVIVLLLASFLFFLLHGYPFRNHFASMQMVQHERENAL